MNNRTSHYFNHFLTWSYNWYQSAWLLWSPLHQLVWIKTFPESNLKAVLFDQRQAKVVAEAWIGWMFQNMGTSNSLAKVNRSTSPKSLSNQAGLYIRAGSRWSSPASLPGFAGYFNCFTSLNMSRRWTHNRLLLTKLRLLKILKKRLIKIRCSCFLIALIMVSSTSAFFSICRSKSIRNKAEMYPECVIASWDALVLLLDAENIERRVQFDAEKKPNVYANYKLQEKTHNMQLCVSWKQFLSTDWLFTACFAVNFRLKPKSHCVFLSLSLHPVSIQNMRSLESLFRSSLLQE